MKAQRASGRSNASRPLNISSSGCGNRMETRAFRERLRGAGQTVRTTSSIAGTAAIAGATNRGRDGLGLSQSIKLLPTRAIQALATDLRVTCRLRGHRAFLGNE